MIKNLALFTIGAISLTVVSIQVSTQSVKAETNSSSVVISAPEMTKQEPATAQTANTIVSKDGKAVAQTNVAQSDVVEAAVKVGVKKAAFVRSPMVSRIFPSMMQ
jgi:hypothetical protein